jgi:hypothetical protein
MPLQGFATVSMQLPDGSMAFDSSKPAHASSMEVSAGDCHGKVAVEQPSESGSTCSHCAACMSAAAIGSLLATPGVPSVTFLALARPAEQLAAIAETPERPPRTSLA